MRDEEYLPVFLGLSQKAARHGYGWDLLGLTHVLCFPFFPQTLSGFHCILGVDSSYLGLCDQFSLKLWFTEDKNRSNRAWVTEEALVEQAGHAEPLTPQTQAFAPLEPPTDHRWSRVQLLGPLPLDADALWGYEMMPFPAPPLRLTQPGTVSVDIEWGSGTHPLGKLVCGFVQPPPISDAERRAIASRPGAVDAIVMAVACNECEDTIRMYALLDPSDYPSDKLERTSVYLDRAPNQWECKCGKTVVDLTYLKRGVHDLFRRPIARQRSGEISSFWPLYEAGALATISREFQTLVNSDPAEEQVQEFMEEHPVVWYFLSAERILHKPQVLTKKEADFGVLTSQRILYLIEIEKPQTRLVKRQGGIHHALQKGLDQIRDWRVVVQDHRLALLDALDLAREEVHDIRYMLIAGLAQRTPNEELMKLRRDPATSGVELLCFDEVASSLRNLEGHLVQL